nr:LacI family DNA-binding transcriptional regulator [uncultured Erwinia sp.]
MTYLYSKKNPTIQDIARLSGLSTATVDRVLNQRPGVRENTRQRVEEALRQFSAQQNSGQQMKIAFVLEAGTSYIELVKSALERVKTGYPAITTTFDSVPNYQRDAQVFSQLLKARVEESDAVVLVSREDVQVNSEVRSAGARGVPVICLSTDLPHSAAYVGVDEVSAGANAALLMGKMLPVKAAKVLFVVSATYRNQEEREMGFRRIVRNEFPHLEIQEKISSNDESEETYKLIKKYLQDNRDIAAVYNVAGGNRGIARALAEEKLTGKVIFIGHELTEHSQRMLEQDDACVIFGHDTDREIEACFTLAQRLVKGEPVRASYMPLLVFTKYSRFDLPSPVDNR